MLAQTHTEKITKELSFEKSGPDNALLIANINGDVKVIGYERQHDPGGGNKDHSGKTQTRLEEGKAKQSSLA